MAFTESQQIKILRHLGWPAKTLIPGSLHYAPRLLTRFEDLTQEMENEVISILTQVEKITEQIYDSISRMKVASIDEIALNQGEINQLRSERRRLINELAILLDIDIRSMQAGF